MSGRYIPTKEAAGYIREALKKAFPGVKFSVRTHSYSGGSHVSIQYDDGPTTKAVDDVVSPFYGTGFDGMTDSTTYHDSELNGERVHFGGSAPSVYRNITQEKAKLELAKELIRCTCRTETDKYGRERFGCDDLERLAWRVLMAQDYLSKMNLSDSLHKALNPYS